MHLTPLLLAATMLAGPIFAQPVFAQSAGGSGARPNQAPAAHSISPNQAIKMFQPLGSFPTNTVTNRPSA